MKKYLIYIATAAMLTGCDQVGPDDRYKDMGELDTNKRVLVLDFTGQRCTNCPKAHMTIEQLEEQYGDEFIPVSIHAGVQSLSIDNPRYLGLATPLGETYDAYFGIGPYGYPSMIVDYNTNTVFSGTATEWVTATVDAMQKEAPMELNLTATIRGDEEGEYVIETSATCLSAENMSVKYQLWILEDGIQAPQMGVNGNPKFDNTYVHNNVLRAAINGDWGEDVAVEKSVVTTWQNTMKLTTAFEQTWNVDNLKVVAFLYTPSDGVLQAARAKVVPVD